MYLMDNHAAPISLIFICLMEVVAVSWFYGQYTLTVLLCAIRLLAEYPLPSAVPQYTLTVLLCANRLLAEYPLPSAVPQYTLTAVLCAIRLLAEYTLPLAFPQYTLTVAPFPQQFHSTHSQWRFSLLGC